MCTLSMVCCVATEMSTRRSNNLISTHKHRVVVSYPECWKRQTATGISILHPTFFFLRRFRSLCIRFMQNKWRCSQKMKRTITNNHRYLLIYEGTWHSKVRCANRRWFSSSRFSVLTYTLTVTIHTGCILAYRFYHYLYGINLWYWC